MANTINSTATMVPLSGRIPEDLYQWLATMNLEGASTTSDKLRVALGRMKQLQEGNHDFLEALAFQRDLNSSVKQQITILESEHRHSEVLAAYLEHIPVLMAILASAQVGTLDDARKLEDQLTKRLMQLTESLLRQALTTEASAHDVDVIKRHSGRLREIVELLKA